MKHLTVMKHLTLLAGSDSSLSGPPSTVNPFCHMVTLWEEAGAWPASAEERRAEKGSEEGEGSPLGRTARPLPPPRPVAQS